MKKLFTKLFTSLEAELFWVVFYWIFFGVTAPAAFGFLSISLAKFVELQSDGDLEYWKLAPTFWIAITYWVIYHNIRVVRIGRKVL